MKKIIIIVVLALGINMSAQTTLYQENFGIPSLSTYSVSNYYGGTTPSTYNNSFPIVYTGTGRITNSTVTTGAAINQYFPSNNTGSSGQGYVYLYSTLNTFQLEGMNTENKGGLKLSLNLRCAGTIQKLKIEQSSDGVTYSEVVVPTVPPYQWVNIELTNILSTPNLRLRFSGLNLYNTTFGASGSVSLDDIKVTYTSTLSTDTYNKVNFTVYPNPSQDYVNFTEIVNYELYSLQGSVLKRGFSDKINIEDLSKGVYLLMVELEGKRVIKEIIKK
jgi:hypothetical protein